MPPRSLELAMRFSLQLVHVVLELRSEAAPVRIRRIGFPTRRHAGQNKQGSRLANRFFKPLVGVYPHRRPFVIGEDVCELVRKLISILRPISFVGV